MYLTFFICNYHTYGVWLHLMAHLYIVDTEEEICFNSHKFCFYRLCFMHWHRCCNRISPKDSYHQTNSKWCNSQDNCYSGIINSAGRNNVLSVDEKIIISLCYPFSFLPFSRREIISLKIILFLTLVMILINRKQLISVLIGDENAIIHVNKDKNILIYYEKKIIL